ncbi:hypothetical protein IWQ61_008773 [Dispira simplex]|nr:hypothetical protein IWQ61_008773 [Dispira simplex]
MSRRTASPSPSPSAVSPQLREQASPNESPPHVPLPNSASDAQQSSPVGSDQSSPPVSRSWEVVSSVSERSFEEQREEALQEFGPGTFEYEIAAQYVRDSLLYDTNLMNHPQLQQAMLSQTSITPSGESVVVRPTVPSTRTFTELTPPAAQYQRSTGTPHTSLTPALKASPSECTDTSDSTASPAPRRGHDSDYYDQEKREFRYIQQRIPVQPQFHSRSQAVPSVQQFTNTGFPSSASTHVVPMQKETADISVSPGSGSPTSLHSQQSLLGSFPMFSKAMYIQPDGRIPKGALGFLFGFLFFPLWWLASVWPRHSVDEVDIIWKRYNRWMAGFSLVLLGVLIGAAIWYGVHDT